MELQVFGLLDDMYGVFRYDCKLVDSGKTIANPSGKNLAELLNEILTTLEEKSKAPIALDLFGRFPIGGKELLRQVVDLYNHGFKPRSFPQFEKQEEYALLQ